MDEFLTKPLKSSRFYKQFFRRRTVFAAGLALLLILLFLSWLAFEYLSREATKSANLMGTTVEVTVIGPQARSHAKAVLRTMKAISNKLDWRNPKSEIGIINSMAGIARVAVSYDTYDVVSRSLKLSRTLGGTFDITIGPLANLWKIKEGVPPSPEAIRGALGLVNWRNVDIDPDTETIMLKKRGMKINLDGVGKGYAVARARELLVSRGVKSAMISTGSTIAVIGKRGDGKNWRAGIQHPRDPGKVIGIVVLKPGESLSTSGDYERYFEYKGKRYHHLLNPRTGYPAGGCQSVTIVAPDATVADILSTAIFIMGPKWGLRYIRSLSGVEGVIVGASGSVLKSSGLELEEAKK